jgi:hypothetical protein
MFEGDLAVQNVSKEYLIPEILAKIPRTWKSSKKHQIY